MDNKKETSENKNGRKPGRDPRGVRINNYTETTHGRHKSEPIGSDSTQVLIDTFKKSFETIAEGGAVVLEGAGRPPKYPTVQSFVDVVNEYIQYIADTYEQTGVDLIPDIEGFCAYAKIDRSTLFDWEKTRPPEYSNVIKRLKTLIASYKKQLALKGKIPPVVFAIDFNNNHDYIQQNKTEVQINHGAELPSTGDIMRKIPQSNTTTDYIEGKYKPID